MDNFPGGVTILSVLGLVSAFAAIASIPLVGDTFGYPGSSEYRIYENLSTIEEVRSVLKAEVDRYNNHQVHSTTGEIPNIRFARARKEGNSLFRKFSLPEPYTSLLDVFCLRTTRMVNGYRRISLFNHTIEVPNVPLREEVEIHLTPDEREQIMHIRIWWNNKMVHTVSLPLLGFRVHF